MPFDPIKPMTSSSAMSNGVATRGTTANSSYDQVQIQDLINKLDELITALRR
jgi:hypothetical protein